MSVTSHSEQGFEFMKVPLIPIFGVCRRPARQSSMHLSRLLSSAVAGTVFFGQAASSYGPLNLPDGARDWLFWTSVPAFEQCSAALLSRVEHFGDLAKSTACRCAWLQLPCKPRFYLHITDKDSCCCSAPMILTHTRTGNDRNLQSIKSFSTLETVD